MVKTCTSLSCSRFKGKQLVYHHEIGCEFWVLHGCDLLNWKNQVENYLLFLDVPPLSFCVSFSLALGSIFIFWTFESDPLQIPHSLWVSLSSLACCPKNSKCPCLPASSAQSFQLRDYSGSWRGGSPTKTLAVFPRTWVQFLALTVTVACNSTSRRSDAVFWPLQASTHGRHIGIHTYT